jgi:chloramphenicol-sensitive protein RarD
VFHERMPPARLGGFCLVWVALVLLTVDGVRHQRRARTVAAGRLETEPVAA